MNKLQLIELVKSKKVIVGVSSTVSFMVGAAFGVAYAKKILEERIDAKYSEQVQVEIEIVKEFYKAMYKKEEFKTPEETVEAVTKKDKDNAEEWDKEVVVTTEIEQTLQDYGTSHIPKVKKERKTTEIVEEYVIPTDIFDLEEEIKNRDTERPYIISEEEYLQADVDWEQVTVTYFEGDDVYADDRDEVISDVDDIIGLNNVRFGYGSKNNNVVFVRNEKIEMDMEITRDLNKYSQVVLGFIEHSHEPTIKKFRNNNERE